MYETKFIDLKKLVQCRVKLFSPVLGWDKAVFRVSKQEVMTGLQSFQCKEQVNFIISWIDIYFNMVAIVLLATL